MKKVFSAKGNQKKAGVLYLYQKINFKTKTVTKRANDACYIMKKVSIQQKDIMFVNIYVNV